MPRRRKQAEKLYRGLVEAGTEARLLDATSAAFSCGVTVRTAHLAKGLEFDRVIVPDANAQTYHTEMDRNLLYVACTRPMHRLTLIAIGECRLARESLDRLVVVRATTETSG